MGEIVEKLKLSLGSVSQGLKVLKGLEAISVRHSDTARKDLFTAETDFGRFLSCFLKDRVQPGVQSMGETIERIRRQASSDLGCESGVAQRIDGIQGIYLLLADLVPAVKGVLETTK
jgi:DNA-binding transcriptional regulator GbsR (MarR family)